MSDEHTFQIREMRHADWPAVRRIYEEGIESRVATFETSCPPWDEWNASHLAVCRLVGEDPTGVVGWAALSPVSDRCAYGGVAEVSVYVAATSRGQGVGTRLLEQLVEASEEAGLWTLQAGVFAENESSVRMHERAGFRIVGTRERLGRLGGAWKDVMLLERRSSKVGQ